jgi:hypothetical protein
MPWLKLDRSFFFPEERDVYIIVVYSVPIMMIYSGADWLL